MAENGGRKRPPAVIEDLLDKGEDNLTPEEDALIELLAGLVHDFEAARYPIVKGAAHEMVAFLLAEHEEAQRSLARNWLKAESRTCSPGSVKSARIRQRS